VHYAAIHCRHEQRIEPVVHHTLSIALWTRIGSIRGSGRVGSRVIFTFYRIFLCIIFIILYFYCCHLIGQDSTDQCVVQDQITSNGCK